MAEQVAMPANEPATDATWQVETHGIDVIPERDRHGHPSELFSVWLAANVVLTYIITGSVLIFFGLSFWEALLAILLGNVLYILVGLCGIPGPRAGTATMAISRGAFGLRGNLAPTFLSWLTVVGWQAVNLVLGAFALFALADEVGVTPTDTVKAILLAALTLVTYIVAILGHATIVTLQRVLTFVLAGLMIGVAVQVIPDAEFGYGGGELAASNTLATFILGVILVAALPLSWVNYAADYTRYLRPTASRSGVTLWAALGGAIPAIGIGVIGVMAATAADLTDPVGGFQPLLASWYFVPFLIVVVLGTIANNFLNTYTSGLTLLALGLRVRRWRTILIDGVLASGASVYAIFFHDFTPTFIEFLALMIIWLAPWCAVYLVDVWLRRGNYDGYELLREHGGRYWFRNGFNSPAVIAWLVGMGAAALFTNSTRLHSPVAVDLLGGADLSIFAGLIVAGGIYYAMRVRELRGAASTAVEARS